MQEACAIITKNPLRATLWTGLVALALAGCASSHDRIRQADTELKHHVDRGYLTDVRRTTVSSHDTWTIGPDAVDISLMIPSGDEAYPLVIYLPGLGESSTAGLAWRRAWAEAGYAVLSMQPANLGPAVWSSELARAGDFQTLAKDRFSAHSLAKRLTILRGIFAELNRRQRDAGAGPFRHLDLSRVAVAGFDLGAETAMLVAGEQVGSIEAQRFPEAVKSVIALSPYADFSGMGVERLFRSIHLPVLSVTSPEDTDPYGLVTSAAVRRAPFQYMPPGRKYLLILSAAPHSLISGQPQPAAEGKPDQTGRGERSSQDSADKQPRSGGRRGGRGSRGRGMAERPSSPRDGPSSATWMMQLANVEGMTTAYLDATVKNDPVAWEWLQKDAKRWLGESAQLFSK